MLYHSNVIVAVSNGKEESRKQLVLVFDKLNYWRQGKFIFAFSFREISAHCGGEGMAKVLAHGGRSVWQSFLTCLWPRKQRTPLKPVGITLKHPHPGLLLPVRVPKIAQILEFQNMSFRIVLKTRNKEFKIRKNFRVNRYCKSSERRARLHTKETPVRLLVDSVEEILEGRKECDSLFTFLKHWVADPKH